MLLFVHTAVPWSALRRYSTHTCARSAF
jgi:hypothetical protein